MSQFNKPEKNKWQEPRPDYYRYLKLSLLTKIPKETGFQLIRQGFLITHPLLVVHIPASLSAIMQVIIKTQQDNP